MAKKEQRPHRREPAKGVNINQTGYHKDSKKSCKNIELKKKVLRTLNDAYSVTDIADKFDITYPQAYCIIREFCDDGRIIFTGSKRNRTNKRMTFHYQKISYYYKQNPGERERHHLLDMQRSHWEKTGEFLPFENL